MVSDDKSSTDPYLDLLKSDNHMLSRRSQYNGRNALSVREEVRGEDTESGETTDTESEESEEEDWQTGPPVDYLEIIQVRRYFQWILTAEGEIMDYHGFNYRVFHKKGYLGIILRMFKNLQSPK